MAKQQIQADIDRTFYAAEQAGLKLAIKGRLVALLLVGAWLVFTRGPDRAGGIVIAVLVLAALGLMHYVIVGSKYDRKWVKYVFLTIDVALLSAAVAVLPPEPNLDLPQIYMFKFDVFYYYYIVLAVAAFSLSPGLVFWAGLSGAGGWLAAFAWVHSRMESPLEWGDALAGGSRDHFISVFLSENFAATGSRFQEALVLLVVAILIAVVMHRARRTLLRQIEAERDTATISQIFGRFVPQAVATSMIEDRGVLDPVEREATVLFADIAGFTSLTESKGPSATVDLLNTYFDAATEIISEHHGVVTQFQGDGLLAVFNVPVENTAHVRCAFDSATAILAKVRDASFAGEQLKVRIGLNTGPVFAGNVGGGGRQSYTVYGDTVNLAARLEALNKEHGTSLLMSQSVADALADAELQKIGEVEIRGLSAPVGVHTVAGV